MFDFTDYQFNEETGTYINGDMTTGYYEELDELPTIDVADEVFTDARGVRDSIVAALGDEPDGFDVDAIVYELIFLISPLYHGFDSEGYAQTWYEDPLFCVDANEERFAEVIARHAL